MSPRRKREVILTEFAMFLLDKLGEKTLRRTDWEILCQPCSYNAFNSALRLLLKGEFVVRVERGIYRITERGKKIVKTFENNS